MKLAVRYISFSLFLLISFSCKDKDSGLYSYFVDLGPEGIIPEYEYLFYPFGNDSIIGDLGYYDISLVIRYSEKCKIQNIPFSIETGSLEIDSVFSEKVSVSLFDKNDFTEGKGSMGIYQVSTPLFKNVKAQNGYFIAIYTKQPDNAGIISLGIVAEKL